MRALALVLLLVLGSCQLFESRDMQPLADAAQVKATLDADFAEGWRGVLGKATIEATLKAAMLGKITEFEAASKAHTRAVLDFASKAGKVDWRGLYDQISKAAQR